MMRLLPRLLSKIQKRIISCTTTKCGDWAIEGVTSSAPAKRQIRSGRCAHSTCIRHRASERKRRPWSQSSRADVVEIAQVGAHHLRAPGAPCGQPMLGRWNAFDLAPVGRRARGIDRNTGARCAALAGRLASSTRVAKLEILAPRRQVRPRSAALDRTHSAVLPSASPQRG
jgi:hypothetical protein